MTDELDAQKHERMFKNFEPKEFPVAMDLWRLAIQIPEPPEESEGGIVIPDEYKDHQKFATYIGMVRSMGPLCYQAVTRSGIDLAAGLKCAVGDWVLFGKHDGEKFRTTDGTLWVVLTDTQVLGKAQNPERFDCMSL